MFLPAISGKNNMAATPHTEKDLLEQAKEAEEREDFSQAADLYEQVIKRHPLRDQPYDRLMIIYRKLKRFKDEFRVINRGIDTFEKFFNKKKEKMLSRHKQLARLSNALMKSTGLKDSGDYMPGPLARWKKRKAFVEKKLKPV